MHGRGEIFVHKNLVRRRKPNLVFVSAVERPFRGYGRLFTNWRSGSSRLVAYMGHQHIFCVKRYRRACCVCRRHWGCALPFSLIAYVLANHRNDRGSRADDNSANIPVAVLQGEGGRAGGGEN